MSNSRSHKISSHDTTSSPLKSLKCSNEGEEAHTLSEDSLKSLRESRETSSSKPQKSAKSSRHKKDKVEVFCPVNDRLRIAMDFHKYRLADPFTHYDEQAAKLVAKKSSSLQFQMKS